jgi:TRAP-type C4-dicarboxylate transport system substrate-binding protein
MRSAAKSAALTAALLTGLWSSAAAEETKVVKLATLIPAGSVWDRTLKAMGAEWTAVTAGRVRLRIYGGGVAGDDPDVVRKMRIGQLQAATVTITGLTEIDPAFALFEIPMFFASYDEYFHVLEELRGELERRLDARGFVLLHWGHAGWVYFFSTRPAPRLEDFQELGVFVWAGNARMTAMWRDHGFRPVPLAATDILTGLETGMFEALPSTPIAALSLQWFRSAPFMLDLPVAPLLGATLMTKTAWQTIDPADREELATSAARAGDVFRREVAAQDEHAISEMSRRGLTVVAVPDTAARGTWLAAATRFADSMREAFVPPEIHDRARVLRDAYRRAKSNDSTP